MKISLIGITNSTLPSLTQDTPYEYCAKIMGTCVSADPYNKMVNETKEKTRARLEETLRDNHGSGYDQIYVNCLFTDFPKIFFMYLNNQQCYAAEETSGRHVKLKLPQKEQELYNKWYEINLARLNKIEFSTKNTFINENRKKQIAKENARSITTVNAGTNIVYASTLRQLNYLCIWTRKLLAADENSLNALEKVVRPAMQMFVNEAEKLEYNGEKLINPNLQDPYNRDFIMFRKNDNKEQYGFNYLTHYDASVSAIAQLQRHRPIHYTYSIHAEPKFYINPLISGDNELEKEFKADILEVDGVAQASMLNVEESGNIDAFIMKTNERFCTRAQLEIHDLTHATYDKFKDELYKSAQTNLYNELCNRYKNGGNRCMNGYKCKSPCGYPEGVQAKRII